MQGVLIGLLFGLLFGLFFTGPAFLGVLLYGAVFGAAFSALGRAAMGGRRDFASATRMEAERYELQVDDEVADEARRVLEGAPRLEGPA